MPTKISRYCEGILEAAWLAALILTPLFFNIYSSRIFEPDKLTLLRSLSLVILAAWLIKVFAEGGVRWEKLQPGASRLKFIIKFPLVAPAAATAVLYLISTIFSITPRTSFFGSYQRLQGTYTTLSYLVIFLSVIANLRRREQLERLMSMAILTSLPIALYGVLQRYKIDPVPWGGDTSLRIAANMGNSIFVAAYLIMVIPLTLGRMVQTFGAILREEGRMGAQVARATVYVFIGALQVIALYMSGSRGPALGWMAGTFFLFLLLSMLWRKRWLTLSIVGAALALGAFLVVFNLEGGPLESLRKSPAIGRFGLLLNAESNSALVRKYIWEGAADLVTPHEPLNYPDGRTDVFNFLRPLIGYGPESMYVAYNPFYVPELAIVERRNASPDRSHNETWDALVITGVLGILVYLAVFTLVFYYGLKWIGLIAGKKQRNLYLSLWLGSGALGAVGLGLWRGVEYFGVGLPFGMLIGLLAYLTLAAILAQYREAPSAGEMQRSLTLIVLIAAIVSHFVEINFGIAIASTRTYFWMYAGLLVCAGAILPLHGEYGALSTPASPVKTTAGGEERKSVQRSAKKKMRARSGDHTEGASWLEDYRPVLAAAMLVALVLITLGYDFIANPRGIKSGLDVLWGMLTRLPNKGNVVSFGILSMMLTTWIAIAVVLVAESSQGVSSASWWRRLGVTLGLSLAVALVYWLWQSGTLAFMARQSATDLQKVMDQVGRYANILGRYYFVILVVLLALAAFLLPPAGRLTGTPTVGYFVASAVALLVGVIIVFTNLRVIQADITFKIAEPFSRSGNWPAAIAIYNRANQLAPQEDYYYLFLGRAYLEHAKTLESLEERDRFIGEAEKDLLKAQELNPLNTDHTANLARLYSLWATFAQNKNSKDERGAASEGYFSKALILSPNSALLMIEWSNLYLNVMQQPEKAFEKIQQALEIDPQYHKSYGILADYYFRQARAQTDPALKQDALVQAEINYQKAMELPTIGEPAAKYSYALSLAGVYLQQNLPAKAVDTYLAALKLAPANADVWRVEEAIATLLSQTGDLPGAVQHLQTAIQRAPESELERLNGVLTQLQGGATPP